MKLGWFWWNLVHRFLNKFAEKSYKRFPPHLDSWIVSLYTTLWNFMPIAHMLYHWVITDRNTRIYPILTVPPIRKNWIQYYSAWLVLQEVYKICITDLDELKQSTDSGVGQAGSCRHCWQNWRLQLRWDKFCSFCNNSKLGISLSLAKIWWIISHNLETVQDRM